MWLIARGFIAILSSTELSRAVFMSKIAPQTAIMAPMTPAAVLILHIPSHRRLPSGPVLSLPLVSLQISPLPVSAFQS